MPVLFWRWGRATGLPVLWTEPGILARELAAFERGASHYQTWAAQLDRLQVRAQLLLKALRVFYASLGLFATAALVSVVGSIVTYYGQQTLFHLAAGLALFAGALAVLGLASGCFSMVRETRLAVQNLAEEAKIQTNYRRSDQPPGSHDS